MSDGDWTSRLDPATETVVIATPDLAGRVVGKRLGARHVRERRVDATRLCDVIFGWGIGHELLDGFETVGWERGYGDVVARVDGQSLRRLAWWPTTELVLADPFAPDGSPFPVAPRAILRRQLERLEAAGFGATVASELEFTLFRETQASLVAKEYTGLTLAQERLAPELLETTGLDESFLADLRAQVEASGIALESVKAEYSTGQFELVLEPCDALEMADRHVLYKLAVREIARRHGGEASFMAKWHEAYGGSSCHLHLSLTGATGANAFADGHDDLLPSAIAGLLRHARDLFLLFAPYPNSYKRLRPGTFAPTSLSWGEDNRTAAFRVAGSGTSRHLENRIPGADVNPYLAYAGMVAAVLAGIEQPAAPTTGVGHANAYAVSDQPTLPASLGEAIEAFRTSAFCRAAFGDVVVDHLVNFAAQELAASALAVTDWDRRRLFAI